MYNTVNMFSLDNLVQMAMRKVVEVIFQGASLVVDTIRTFFLVVLSVLGPLAFAISVFDGFHNTLIRRDLYHLHDYRNRRILLHPDRLELDRAGRRHERL